MRLPHLATLIRPTVITDGYGDEVPGPLAPVCDPVPAWLQVTSSTEATSDGVAVLVTATRLYLRAGTVGGVAIAADDVVEVGGVRYAIDGTPFAPVNPRGRARFIQVNLKAVTHGG